MTNASSMDAASERARDRPVLSHDGQVVEIQGATEGGTKCTSRATQTHMTHGAMRLPAQLRGRKWAVLGSNQ